MNVRLLRKLTDIPDSQIGSIKLVEEYLSQRGAEPAEIVAVLKHLNRLRQGYPVHGDRADGVLEAHEFFQLPYPIEDWGRAWRTLLLNYLDALKKLFDALRDVGGPTETEDEGSAQQRLAADRAAES